MDDELNSDEVAISTSDETAPSREDGKILLSPKSPLAAPPENSADENIELESCLKAAGHGSGQVVPSGSQKSKPSGDSADEGEIVDDDDEENQEDNQAKDEQASPQLDATQSSTASIVENGVGDMHLTRQESGNNPNGGEMPPGDHQSGSAKDDNRFRILSLHYPVDVSHPKIQALMLAAQSFHMWMERGSNHPQQKKNGVLALTFDTEAQAKEMYGQIKDLTIGGSRLQISAPASFLEPKPAICSLSKPEVPEPEPDFSKEDAEVHQKLYLSNLLPSADNDLMLEIFGRENVKLAVVMPDESKTDGSQTAVVTFRSPAQAKAGYEEYNEFTLDDGENQCELKIVPFIEHLRKVYRASKAAVTAKTRQGDTLKSSEGLPEPGEEDDAYDEYYGIKSGSDDGAEPKAKGGSLWSAQLSSNKMEPVEAITNYGRAVTKAAVREPPPILQQPLNQWKPEEPIVASHLPFPVGRMPSNVELQGSVIAVLTNAGVAWTDLNGSFDLFSLVDQVKDAIKLPASDQNIMKAIANILEAERKQPHPSWTTEHLVSLLTAARNELKNMQLSSWRRDDAPASRSPRSLAPAAVSRSAAARERERASPKVVIPSQATEEAKLLSITSAMGSNAPEAAATATQPSPATPTGSSEPPPGVDYVPVPEKKQRKNKKDKNQVIGLMGVGAMLAGLMNGGGGGEAESKLEPGQVEEKAVVKETPSPSNKPLPSNKAAPVAKSPGKIVAAAPAPAALKVPPPSLAAVQPISEYPPPRGGTGQEASAAGPPRKRTSRFDVREDDRERMGERQRGSSGRRSRSPPERGGRYPAGGGKDRERDRRDRRRRTESSEDSSLSSDYSGDEKSRRRSKRRRKASSEITAVGVGGGDLTGSAAGAQDASAPNLMAMMQSMLGAAGGGMNPMMMFGAAMPQIMMMMQQMQRMLSALPPAQQQAMMGQMQQQLGQFFQMHGMGGMGGGMGGMPGGPPGGPGANPAQMMQFMQMMGGGGGSGMPPMGMPGPGGPHPGPQGGGGPPNPMLQMQQMMSQMQHMSGQPGPGMFG